MDSADYLNGILMMSLSFYRLLRRCSEGVAVACLLWMLYQVYFEKPTPEVFLTRVILACVVTAIAAAVKIYLEFAEINLTTSGEYEKQSSLNVSGEVPKSAIWLLKWGPSSLEERENIIGDLLEEFIEFESRATAYVWLYKQLIKSLFFLAYRNLKSRLASYFGERVR